MYKTANRSTKFPVILFGLTIFLLPISYGNTSAQENKNPIVKIEGVETERSRTGDVLINVTFRTELPQGAVVRFYLHNDVQRHNLREQKVRITGGGKQSIKFGPLNELWESTYMIVSVFKEHENRHVNWDKGKNYSPKSKKEFTYGSDVPTREEQHASFKESLRKVVLLMREVFLDINWEVRKAKNNEDADPGKIQDQAREKLDNLHETMQSMITRYDVYGCPFRRSIQPIKQARDPLLSFGEKMLKTLEEPWEPPEDSHYEHKSVRQRIEDGIASPDDLRKYFLSRYFDLASQVETPTEKTLQEISGTLSNHLHKLLSLCLPVLKNSSQTEDTKEANQKWKEFQNEFQSESEDISDRINRLIWLYKDRKHLPGYQKNLYDWSKQLTNALNALKDTTRIDLPDPQSDLTEKLNRIEPLLNAFFRLMWRSTQNSANQTIQYLQSLSSYPLSLPRSKESRSEEARKQQVKNALEELKNYMKRKNPALKNQGKTLEKNGNFLPNLISVLPDDKDNPGKPTRMAKSLKYLRDASENLQNGIGKSMQLANNLRNIFESRNLTPVQKGDKAQQLSMDELVPLKQSLQKRKNEIQSKKQTLYNGRN